MKMDIDMKARLLFIAFLLVLATGALIWYFLAATHYATYQIYTKDSVSGLIVDAPIEFHGVEVGKVKSVKLLEPQLVGIVLNVEKERRSARPPWLRSFRAVSRRAALQATFTFRSKTPARSRRHWPHSRGSLIQ